ncbi:competence type IV pilus assembly protein ComGB [Niallia taxi]|uniref:competence type IV pilus assembly protein ComGB n=1 Tax=Niallia taxi TaxID=2499688 RepID=UPI00119DBFDA|nr:competence type IV pilus assembly protein ComGB [Niallia taxi]MCT2346304.1 type II secretion system F family protein [Niallia taxi]WOD64351.1 competence type IV pilus assembly protein ComGB [Niallia taxi]
MLAGFMKIKKDSWSLREQSLFLKCIGELLTQGYSLSEGVRSSVHYLPADKQEDIMSVLGSLKGGNSFCDNLARLKFNQQTISYVYFAEKHGGFAKAFLDASNIMQNRLRTLQQLKKILYYPLFLVLFTIILFYFVHQVLLPQFSSLFLSMSVETNLFMSFIIGAGRAMPFVLLLIGAFLLSLLYYYLRIFRKKDSLERLRLMAAIPVIGKCFSLYYTYIFSLQLSHLLQGGFSIFESLKFFQEAKENAPLALAGEKVIDHLKKGERMEQAFLCLTFLEKEFCRILQHGQENGKLDQELHFLSQFCMDSLQDMVNRLMKKIQPVIYAVIGILVISIYLAVLLPMFQLLNGL